MTAAAPVYFACLDCPLLGTTDRTAEQHVRATGHATLTATDPARLARMRARVGGEGTRPDCRCVTPARPTGREPEQKPPWTCLTCGGYACEYADEGQTRCSPAICDCFIATHPDSPRALHPEAFSVGGEV